MRLVHFCSVVVCLFFFAQRAQANFFVQLKKPYTVDDLLKSDDQILNVKDHVRAFVDSRISFGSFNGFSGHFQREVVRRLLHNKMVLNIVRDVPIKVFDEDLDEDHFDDSIGEAYDDTEDTEIYKPGPTPAPLLTSPGKENEPRDSNAFAYETQFMAPRHLARLSRRGCLPFAEPVNYYYDPTTLGKGVYVYVIDTGINKDHPDFEGRVVHSQDFTVMSGRGDRSGHGTHVAGLVASKTFGVAKSASLIDLKALGSFGEGTLSTVLSAIQYAVEHRAKNGYKAVANLSLGSYKNEVLNEAIDAAFESGLVVVVAAGNFGTDSCKSSPAGAKQAISVGSIDDRADSMALFSNWGECVSVFASGVMVSSVHYKHDERSLELSGTSMSSPIIAGLAAVMLSEGVDPKDVKTKILEMSTPDVIGKIEFPGTPNRVAFNGVPKEDDYFSEELMFNEKVHGPLTRPTVAKVLHLSMGIQDETQREIDEWSDYLSQVEPGSMEALFGPGWENECKDVESEMRLIYDMHKFADEGKEFSLDSNAAADDGNDYEDRDEDGDGLFGLDDEVVDESDAHVKRQLIWL